jgi:transposase
MTTESKSPKFSSEVRERAVRMVFEHRTEHASQWAAIVSIAAKIGCTAQTLSNWVRQAERDQGKRPGTSTGDRPVNLPRACPPPLTTGDGTAARPA